MLLSIVPLLMTQIDPFAPRPVSFTHLPPLNTQSVALVGSFNNWDRAAFQLKLQSDGKTWKGTFKIAPGVHPYLFVENGKDDPKDILRSCDKALLVTRGLGAGVNTVTGEYSRGANGLWIERGEVVQAVQEVTIAADFLTMLQNIDAVGSDLVLKTSTACPTLRVSQMTIAGS